MIYFILIAAIIALDQYAKHVAASNLAVNQSIPLIDGVVNLTHVQNFGAAFSILQNQQLFLIMITGVVSLVILVMLIKSTKTGHWTMLLSFSMILGGGVGNLIDRVKAGYVVDFIELKFFAFPVFNIADIAVVSGSILLVLYVLFIESAETRKKENPYVE